MFPALQAVAAVLADLPDQFVHFKQQLLTELESQLLGNWGELLKKAAAEETAQQVEAGLKVRCIAESWLRYHGGEVGCLRVPGMHMMPGIYTVVKQLQTTVPVSLWSQTDRCSILCAP